MEVGKYSVSCRFKNCEDGFCWIFSGVYGPTVKVEREDFLSEVGAIRGLWNEPWCFLFSFNILLLLIKKNVLPDSARALKGVDAFSAS